MTKDSLCRGSSDSGAEYHVPVEEQGTKTSDETPAKLSEARGAVIEETTASRLAEIPTPQEAASTCCSEPKEKRKKKMSAKARRSLGVSATSPEGHALLAGAGARDVATADVSATVPVHDTAPAPHDRGEATSCGEDRPPSIGMCRRRCRKRLGPKESVNVAFDTSNMPCWHSWPEGDCVPELCPGKMSQLRVFCATWNLAGQPLRGDFGSFLGAIPARHHIYAIGFCECGHGSLREELLAKLGDDYIVFAEESLQQIRAAVVIHRSLYVYCREPQTAQVATGLLNLYGNKGSVQIAFRAGDTRMLFICAHLNCGQGETRMLRRNKDFVRILLQSPLLTRRGADDARTEAETDEVRGLHSEYDCVFLMGDLNFRVRATRDEVDGWLAAKQLSQCLEHEELLSQINKEPSPEDETSRIAPTRSTSARTLSRSIGLGGVCATFPPEFWEPPGLWKYFAEHPINFYPTYKYDKGFDMYDTSGKRRVPSWTDRVLWKHNESIRVKAYDAVQALRRSDHRPVFAQFEVAAVVHPTE